MVRITGRPDTLSAVYSERKARNLENKRNNEVDTCTSVSNLFMRMSYMKKENNIGIQSNLL